jgi:hypothetical protein
MMQTNNLFSYDTIWSMNAPKLNLMAIVSSTFTDTAVERNILMHRILPELRRAARQYVNINICLVDLRWGLKDSNTNDHLTWISCANEITRCREESGGIFFISLQSEKYGYCPLPRSIPEVTFTTCISNFNTRNDIDMSTREKIIDLAKRWYILDENNIPAEYVLKSLTTENKDEYWSTVLSQVLQVFLDTPCYEYMFQTSSDLIVGRSVTEYEFKFGMQNIPEDVKRCIWIRRVFEETEITESMDSKWLFCDTHEASKRMKKCNLLNHMENILNRATNSGTDAAIIDIVDKTGAKVYIPLSSYTLPDDQKDEFRLKYEEVWYNVVSKRLSSELSVLIDKSKQWDMSGGVLNLRGSIVNEILHHYEWCREKCSSFVGREGLIEEVIELIYGNMSKPDVHQIRNLDTSTGDMTDIINRLRRVNGAIVGKSGAVRKLFCLRV